jgi:predicted Zn finger-like uncharacterized protein
MSEATQRVDVEGTAEGRQVIVQCPGCQTKFLVGSASLKGVDFPRFHCSRCDNLFSLDANLLGADGTPESALPPPAHPTAPLQNDLFSDDHAPAVAVEEIPMGTVTRELAPPPAIDDFAPVAESAVKGLRFEPPSPPSPRVGSTRGIEIPKGIDGSPRVAPPVETRGEPSLENQIEFDFIASSIPADRLFEESPRYTANSAPLQRELTPVRRAVGWRGIAPFGLSMLGCLALLGIFAFSIGNNRAYDTQVLNTLFPNAPQVASPDLRIIDTSFEKVPLSNGETIHLITGTVVNDSTEDVSNVVLEGLTFDGTGKVVSSAKVTSGATLAHSRLQSLTPDIIVKLQSGKNSRPLRIRAGDSERISLALTDAAARDARFFSARVYSVRSAD